MISGVNLRYIDHFEMDLVNNYYCIHLHYSDATNDDFGSILIYRSKNFGEAVNKYDQLKYTLYKFKSKKGGLNANYIVIYL